MSNPLLQKLIYGDSDPLKDLILEEFPDLFDLIKNPGSTEKNRKNSCIDTVKNDLIDAESVPLLNPPSDFETLPELIGVPRREDILLTPSFSLLLRTYLVLQCHAVSTEGRLPILPAEFLDPISALGKEHFIIVLRPFGSFLASSAGSMPSTGPAWLLQIITIFRITVLHLIWADTIIAKVGRWIYSLCLN